MSGKYISLVAGLLFAVASAHAGDWSIGVESGGIHNRYVPEYTQTDGSPSSQFVNRASGTEFSATAAYRQDVCSRFSMLYQGRIGYSDARWNLVVPTEPSEFEYSTSWTWGLSLIPTVKMCRYAKVSLELGLVRGNMSEMKRSSVDSSYDVDEWVTGYVWGCGLSFPLTERTELTVRYRSIAYENIFFKSYLPDGTHWETITDQPTSESYSAGLTYWF